MFSVTVFFRTATETPSETIWNLSQVENLSF